MRSLLATVLMLVGAGLRAQAPNVAECTSRLGDPDYAVREAAQERLLVGDAAVVPLLELALRNETNPEIRERAASILTELKRRAARDQWLKPEMVTFRFEAKPLKEAVAEIRKIARINVELDASVRNPNRLVTVVAGPLPVWEAVDRFRVAAGLEELFAVDPPSTSQIGTNGLGNGRNFMSYPQSAAMRFGPTPILWKDADKTGVTTSSDRTGAVRVTTLPQHFALNRRIRGAGISLIHLDVVTPQNVTWSDTGSLRITRAEDESGRPVTSVELPASPQPVNAFENVMFFNNGMFMKGGGNTSHYGGFGPKPSNPRYAAVPIRTDDRTTTMLRVLEGSLQGELTIPNETILNIGDLPASAGKLYELNADTTFSVVDVKTTMDGNRTVKLKITAPNPWNLARRGIVARRGLPISLWDDGGFGSSTLKPYQFTDEQGRKVSGGFVYSSSSSDNGVQQTSELDIRFNKTMTAGLPQKLTILGERTIPLEVPFRLTNVAMP